MQRLSSKLSKSSSGMRLLKAKSSPQLDQAQEEEEERGSWSYLVVDLAGIRPRTEATYSKESKSSSMGKLKEGSIVDVSVRRKCGWIRWLGLSTGGWVHDVSPKDYSVRMVEVEVAKGDWEYQVGCDKAVVLSRPSMNTAQKPPRGLPTVEMHEVVKVTERIRPLSSKGSFLRLADGRGFVFDVAKGQQVLHRCHSPGQDDQVCGNQSPSSTTASMGEASTEAPFASLSRSSTSFNLGASETGTWDYIVIDPTGISLRKTPTHENSAKTGTRLSQGDVVKVVERRKGDTTTYLRLDSPPGWVFDMQPCVTNQHQRMAPVDVEHGMWYYRVSATKGVALRSRCSLESDSKQRTGPGLGAILCVSRRVKVGEVLFLRLKAENAWVPESKDGRALVEGPIEFKSHNNCNAAVRASGGLHLLDAPTKERWAHTKKILLKGAGVQVVRSCKLEGEEWALVSQPGGMEGWSFLFNFDLERLNVPIMVAGHGGRCDPDLLKKAFLAPNPVQVA